MLAVRPRFGLTACAFSQVFFGFPLRVVGGAGWRTLEDVAIGAEPPPLDERPWWRGPKPREAPPIEKIVQANSGTTLGKATLAFWGAILGVGRLSGGVRQLVEAADVFVGRYLLLTTVAYVGFKFVHFKLWDPIPF